MTQAILLNAFHQNCVGHQSCGLWRHPRDRSADYKNLSYWTDLAKTLERGLFDGIFLADVSGVYDVYEGTPDAALRTATQVPANDPFTIVPAMAAVTEHLCFGITGSIPYEPPYAFARRISSLDHLTSGRIAWNVVTGYLDSAAKALGLSHQTSHDTRYDIADEYMELVYKLWEGSWADDAVIQDRQRGVFADPSKVRKITHDGEYFKLDAIHLCEPSAQRSPVIFQAGASPRGRQFAGRHAECVFIAGNTPEGVAGTVSDLRNITEDLGRAAADIKIFTMISIIVDETDALAAEKLQDYQQYVQPEGALALMSGWSGVDLSEYGPDESVENASTQAVQSAMQAVGSRSIREWGELLSVGGAAPTIVGSPSTVADQLQMWMDRSGVDGFNLSYTVMPECIESIVDLLVPELQSRGVYKTRYTQGSMREKLFHLGPRLQSPHPAASYRF